MTVEEKMKATVMLDKALTNIESDDSSMIIAVNDNSEEGTVMTAGTTGTLLNLVAGIVEGLLEDMTSHERIIASLVLMSVIRKAGEKE